MERSEKYAVVEELQSSVQSTSSFVVAHYHGLTVNRMQELRADLRSQGGHLRVIKNTLARRVFAEVNKEAAETLFFGPCAIGYAEDDPVVVPRVLKKFSKENEALKIVGGILDGNLLNADQVMDLADLPSLDELRGKLVGLLNSPAQKLVTLMGQPSAGVARVIKARSEQE